MLRTRKKRVDQKALLDSRAMECFIHQNVVKRLGLETKKLKTLQKVRNINSMSNKAGDITEAIQLAINRCGVKMNHIFFVADIGPDDFILGYPFLEACAPVVNWSDATLTDTTTLSTLDTNLWWPLARTTPHQRRQIPLWVCALPDWSPGDEVWQRFIIRKSTVAQQLAIDANKKKEDKPWQELVPKQYHHHT